MTTEWLLTGVSMLGAALTAGGLPRAGHGVWIVGNLGWVIVWWSHDAHPAAALFAFYLLTSIYGFWSWRKRQPLPRLPPAPLRGSERPGDISST